MGQSESPFKNRHVALMSIKMLGVEGYTSEASLNRVDEEKTSCGIDLTILLLDEFGNLLQKLKREKIKHFQFYNYPCYT